MGRAKPFGNPVSFGSSVDTVMCTINRAEIKFHRPYFFNLLKHFRHTPPTHTPNHPFAAEVRRAANYETVIMMMDVKAILYIRYAACANKTKTSTTRLYAPLNRMLEIIMALLVNNVRRVRYNIFLFPFALLSP